MKTNREKSEKLTAASIAGSEEVYQHWLRMIKRWVANMLCEKQAYKIDQELLASVILETALNSIGTKIWRRSKFNCRCCMISIRKVTNAVKKNDCVKRGGKVTTSTIDNTKVPCDPRAMTNPSEIAEFNESIEVLHSKLDDGSCTILKYRMSRFTNKEISEVTGWSLRRVERFLQDIRLTYFPNSKPESKRAKRNGEKTAGEKVDQHPTTDEQPPTTNHQRVRFNFACLMINEFVGHAEFVSNESAFFPRSG